MSSSPIPTPPVEKDSPSTISKKYGSTVVEDFKIGQSPSTPKRSFDNQPGDSHGSSQFMLSLSFLAGIGGFLFGYDTGVISGAMLLLKPEFQLNTVWQEAIVSITIAAAAIFALIGGILSGRFGRRITIMFSSALFTLGAILLAAAQNKTTLLIGRFVVGAGVGSSSATIPSYVSECAPAGRRGFLGTTFQLCITAGMFCASLVDALFSYLEKNGWRYMLGLAALPAVLQFLVFIFMPESPRWLMKRQKYEAARVVFRRIRSSHSVADEELENIRIAYEEEEQTRNALGENSVLCTMIRTPHIRRALIAGCALQLFQQLTGINTIMYYSATVIQMAGVKSVHTSIWLAAAIAAANFFFTFIGMAVIERIGRRTLLLASLIAIMCVWLLLATTSLVAALNSPPVTIEELVDDRCSFATTCDSCISDRGCGYCFLDNAPSPLLQNGSCLSINEANPSRALSGRCNISLTEEDHLTFAQQWCPTDLAWVIVLGMALYLLAFAPGMGPLPWVVNSELYPQWARSTGNACSTATNWVANLIVSMSFLSLIQAMTKQGSYFLYAALTACGAVLFYCVLPETKGKSLEEIEGLFAQPWSLRRQPRDNAQMHIPLHSSALNGDFS